MFRFTIRDVLFLTALVAVACFWVREERRNRVEWSNGTFREVQLRGKPGTRSTTRVDKPWHQRLLED